MTDALLNIEENTSKFAGGRYHKQRYADMFNTNKKSEAKPQETRNGQQIADDIIGRLAGVT